MISRTLIIAIVAAAVLSPARRADAQAQYDVLHAFAGQPDGRWPYKVIQGSDGNFYGVNYGGGAFNAGAVFRMTADGTVTLVHSFNLATDGFISPVELIQGQDGNFYGLAYGGTFPRDGRIFKMTPGGTVSSVYSFGLNTFVHDLMQGLDGTLYGDMFVSFGGPEGSCSGPIWRVTTGGTRLTDLFGTDCGTAVWPLMQAADGSVYVSSRVDSGGYHPNGIFRVIPGGSATQLQGYTAYGLIQTANGKLVGIRREGGAFANGAIFEMTATPFGPVTDRYSFTAADGKYPTSVIQGSDGHLYGTIGSQISPSNPGMVYRVTSGNAFSVLHAFTDGADGGVPHRDLLQGTDGNLYGTTERGGISNNGVAYRLLLPGTLTGYVRDASTNAPIANAQITLNPGGASTVTDGSGLYTLEVAPGTYTLTVTAPLYTTASIPGIVVPRLATITQDVGLAPVGGTITGHVRDATTSAPIMNAVVAISPGGVSTLTDASGLYSRLLPPGTYTLTVSAANYGSIIISGVVVSNGGTTPQDVTLVKVANRISGQVRNAATGAPIPNAQVTINPGGLSLVTDADGAYSTIVPLGTYAVSAVALDYHRATVSGIVIGSGAPTTQDFWLVPIAFRPATYDAVLKAPRCGAGASGCDSATLVAGRASIAGRQEPHQPNTILNSCSDGAGAGVARPEQIDRIKVSTLEGGVFAPGKSIRVDTTVVATLGAGDALDLYYASNAAAMNWIYIATLTPSGAGVQVLSGIFTMTPGSLHAVRARFRVGASPSLCGAGANSDDDQDDVIFGGGAAAGDFDADHRADITVFRPSTGGWYDLHSSSGYTSSSAHTWGTSGDVPVSGDYDGDGKIDPAVFRPSTAGWYVLHSSTNYTTSMGVIWGAGSDITVPGDYDGDGKTDPAVFRPSTGGWYFLMSSTSYTSSGAVIWGASTDTPVAGDYDGDGKTDPAVFRPSTGGWYFLHSSTNYTSSGAVTWGASTDIAVPGDYDGDGRADPAVFRPSTGGWYFLSSSTMYTTSGAVTWGASSDIPVPGDYDGDGKTDPAIFRPSSGLWAILQSSTGFTTSIGVTWGVGTDRPILERP